MSIFIHWRIEMNRKGLKKGMSRKSTILALSTLTDGELVGIVRKGNPLAYQVLVDRYEKLVRSIVSKYLSRDTMAIEDACQETFLKALVRIADLRTPARFKSWVCAIAHNQALDSLRRRRNVVLMDNSGGLSMAAVSEGAPESQMAWIVPDPSSDPGERHDRSEVAGVVQDVLCGIPELYRGPLTLRYEEDLDYQEIADLLGKPLGTIKSLIHRGKVLLKEELTRRAGGPDGAMVLAG
jgi:RNA polymerase sigma-70 factor (ECF subfamily)